MDFLRNLRSQKTEQMYSSESSFRSLELADGSVGKGDRLGKLCPGLREHHTRDNKDVTERCWRDG